MYEIAHKHIYLSVLQHLSVRCRSVRYTSSSTLPLCPLQESKHESGQYTSRTATSRETSSLSTADALYVTNQTFLLDRYTDRHPKKRDPKQMSKHVIVPRKQAIAEGLGDYFTGKPCSHGHLAPRKTSSSSCTACMDEYKLAVTHNMDFAVARDIPSVRNDTQTEVPAWYINPAYAPALLPLPFIN